MRGLQVTSKLPASYQQVREGWLDEGVKVEFGGFISGFGKIFFTKGGIKREKEGFWGWRKKRGKGIGKFWVMYGKGCNMEYSLMECFL